MFEKNRRRRTLATDRRQWILEMLAKAFERIRIKYAPNSEVSFMGETFWIDRCIQGYIREALFRGIAKDEGFVLDAKTMRPYIFPPCIRLKRLDSHNNMSYVSVSLKDAEDLITFKD